MISLKLQKEISRQINSFLEEEDSLSQSYRLDVSSPGIDRSLKFLEQFPRNLDRKFKIKYKKDETTSVFEGKLISVDDTKLCFSVNKDKVILDFDQVVSAHVLISF